MDGERDPCMLGLLPSVCVLIIGGRWNVEEEEDDEDEEEEDEVPFLVLCKKV
jgi:hypothetical protein